MDFHQTESPQHSVCFCWYYFLGPYLHWPFVWWLFCWIVLFPGPTQTSQVHTIWKRPRLYNLNHCFDFGLVWEDSLCQSEEFRFKEACWEWKLKRSLNNVYNLWICILVLCDKSPCPIPPNQTINRECLCPCMCSISMSTSSDRKSVV